MTQEQRVDYMIRYLLNEREEYRGIKMPSDPAEKRRLLRSLLNLRPPVSADENFLNVQDAYLQASLAKRGVINLRDLTPIHPGLYLWQGDITRLAVDAIVNAANSRLLGCFVPCHNCIDNAIHTRAGVQLRLECARIMAAQRADEPTGRAKITKAYNLPCRYVLHTVGPIVCGPVTQEYCDLLASCYRSCLDQAAAAGLRSVAFCCISTGEFHFPNALAAEIAVRTVQKWRQQIPDKIEVVFNVFKDKDYAIYKRLLQ